MVVLTCKLCGGDLVVQPDALFGVCDSCGSTVTLPGVADQRRINLFNRADHFRRAGQFDKAIAAYEQLILEDGSSAEAHWGLLLSRYGIDYVQDPATGERVPTCRRLQLSSVLDDPDYLQALEHASEAITRSLYEQEAARIDAVQRGVLAVSRSEEPYDIFLCYKDTDELGARTLESTLAQDLYDVLTRSGYRVFYARVCLEDKLGQEYEPYIFAALQSAWMMLVVGAQPAHFQAVWVKNEWSRFLALMEQDRQRRLIPCYRDMEPYELPDELSLFQCLDMGRIGFVQDLLQVISSAKPGGGKAAELPRPDRPLDLRPKRSPAPPGIVAAPLPQEEQAYFDRGERYLEQGDYPNAQKCFHWVLELSPGYSPAHWALLLSREQCPDDDTFVERCCARLTEQLNQPPPAHRQRISFRLTDAQRGALEQLRKNPVLLKEDFRFLDTFVPDVVLQRPGVEQAIRQAAESFDLASDPSYQAALRYADDAQRNRLEAVAQRIEAFAQEKLRRAELADQQAIRDARLAHQHTIDDMIQELQRIVWERTEGKAARDAQMREQRREQDRLDRRNYILMALALLVGAAVMLFFCLLPALSM